MSCCILLRLICQLDRREDESAVSGGLDRRGSMRWDDFWRLSAK